MKMKSVLAILLAFTFSVTTFAQEVSFNGSTLVFANEKAYQSTYESLQNQVNNEIKLLGEKLKLEGFKETQFDSVAAVRKYDPTNDVLRKFDQKFQGYISFRASVQSAVNAWLSQKELIEANCPTRYFMGNVIAQTLANKDYIVKIGNTNISFKVSSPSGTCVNAQSKGQWFYASSGRRIYASQSIFSGASSGLVLASTQAYVKVVFWWPAIFTMTTTCKNGFVYAANCETRLPVNQSCVSFLYASGVLQIYVQAIRAKPTMGHYITTHSAFGQTWTLAN